MMHGNGWFMGWGWLFWIAIVAGLVVLILRTWRAGGDRTGTAERILKERFARGEIDREQFEEQLRLLRH